MALTVTYGDRQDAGSQFKVPFTATFDSSYLTSGEVLTAANFGLDRFEDFEIEDSEGLSFDVDIATGGATAQLKAYTVGGKTLSTETVRIKDDDTAASNGVAVYVHTKNGVEAWLEFVSPTNADANLTINNGGSKAFIFDADAAATDGVALYFDEDATNANERLMCVSQSNQDLYLTIAGGKIIKIKDNDTAATDGVQVYCDEDSTNSYDRLLFVSPTNTSGTANTSTTYTGFGLAPAEVASGTDLSSITINGAAYGR